MKIIFVYNVDSGFVNSILDIGHKILSPKTYECNLCNLTYGILSEKEEWKKFRAAFKDEIEFLHKNEFEKTYKEKREYPIILKLDDSENFEVLLNQTRLNKIKEVNELIELLKID